MPYGTLSLDRIESSGNLSLSGNLVVTGNLSSTGRLDAPNTVIKIYQVVKTDAFISASTSWANVTGLSITVSPSNANSKFLLMSDVSVGPNAGAGAYSQRFAKDGSAITGFVGDAASNRPRAMASGYTGDTSGTAGILNITKMYVDSPATTANITYTIQVAGSTTTPGYINRTQRDTDLSGYDPRTTSSFTILEIGG